PDLHVRLLRPLLNLPLPGPHHEPGEALAVEAVSEAEGRGDFPSAKFLPGGRVPHPHAQEDRRPLGGNLVRIKGRYKQFGGAPAVRAEAERQATLKTGWFATGRGIPYFHRLVCPGRINALPVWAERHPSDTARVAFEVQPQLTVTGVPDLHGPQSIGRDELPI